MMTTSKRQALAAPASSASPFFSVHLHRPPVKTFGGKFYDARNLAKLIPSDINTFAELYVGGGSVYLNLHPDRYHSVVLNDLDKPTSSLWMALLCNFETFHAQVSAIEYNLETFTHWRDLVPAVNDTLTIAIKHYVTNKMSRGGMGKSFAWSERLRGGRPGDLNAWMTGLDELKLIRDRLREDDPAIYSTNATTLIPIFGSDPKNFLYLDPPYLHSTRKSKKVYAKEMTEKDHRVMLARILRCKCRVMLSGYHSPLYDRVFTRWAHRGWHFVEMERANHAGQGMIKERRTEVVWLNY